MQLPQRGIPRRLFSFDQADISEYMTPRDATTTTTDTSTNWHTANSGTPLTDPRNPLFWTPTPPNLRSYRPPFSTRRTPLETIDETSENIYLDMDGSHLRARRTASAAASQGQAVNNATFTLSPSEPEGAAALQESSSRDAEYQRALEILDRHGFRVSITPANTTEGEGRNESSSGSYTLNDTSLFTRSADSTVFGNSNQNSNTSSSFVDSSYISGSSGAERARRALRDNNLEMRTMTSGPSSLPRLLPPRLPPRTTRNENVITGPPGHTPAPRAAPRNIPLLETLMSPIGSENSQGSNQTIRDDNENTRDRVRFSTQI